MNIEFESIIMYEPELTSFSMNSTALLGGTPFDCTIGEMKVHVEFHGETLGYIIMPQIHLKKNKKLRHNFQSKFFMRRPDLIDHFVRELVLSNSSSVWTLKASTTVYFSGIVFDHISFEKHIPLPGLAGLTNSSIISYEFPYNGPNNTIVALANVSLWNPSMVGFAFGNITVEAFYKNSFLGHTILVNPMTVPGKNIARFSGYIKPSDLTLAGEAASLYASGKSVELQVRGVSIGDPNIPWLQSMARSLEITTIMKGPKDLKVISNINISFLNASFISNDDMFAGANVTAHFKLPDEFKFPFNVLNVTLNITGNYVNNNFIQVRVPWGVISTSFKSAPFSILNQDSLVSFVRDAVYLPSINVSVEALGSGCISTNVGVIRLDSIAANTTVQIQTLDNFSVLPVEILNLDIIDANPSIATIGGTIKVSNPLDLEVFLSVLPLTVFINGTRVGNVTANPFRIAANSSSLVDALGYLDQTGPGAITQIEQFLSDYADGITSSVTVQGLPEAEPIEILKKALGNITAVFSIPPMETSLIYYVQAFVALVNFIGEIPAKLYVTNPWNVPLHVLGISNGQVSLNDTGQLIATLNVDISNNPITVPGNTSMPTRELIAKIAGISYEELKALIGDIQVDLVAVLHASIGGETPDQGFKVTFQYSQLNVSGSFWPPSS